MTVGLLGESVVVAGAESALSALDTESRRITIEELETVERAIVAAPASSREAFEIAEDRFAADPDTGVAWKTTSTSWVAVELGGVGAREANLSAAVTGFSDGAGCYHCLRTRRTSTVETGPVDDSTGEGNPGQASGSDGGVDAREGLDTADAHLAGVVAARTLCASTPGAADADATTPAALKHTVEVPWRERHWLPVPTCPRCGGRPERSLALSDTDRALEDSLARAERALDDRLGLLRRVGERESFPAPYYVAETADTSGYSDAESSDFAAGVDAEWNPAFMKALGEGLERYCAGVYRNDWFTNATGADIAEQTGAAVIRPESFVTGPGRGEGETGGPDHERPWIGGRSLAAAEPVFLPANRVQFPGPGDGNTITTGLSLGNSTVEAIRGGLCEVIERDATMCTWYSTIDPVGLECDDPGVATLTRRARAEGLAVSLSLSTVDVDVPVVTAAVHRGDPWPRFAMGSGASLDPDAAARSALAEAIQNWMELRAMGRERSSEEEPTLVAYADDPGLASEYLDPESVVHADDLIDGILPAGRDALETLVGRVSEAGLTPYAARITTDDVAALGFEAVRVLVPEAQPLFVGSSTFGERARSVPEAFGEESRLDREHHPYP